MAGSNRAEPNATLAELERLFSLPEFEPPHGASPEALQVIWACVANAARVCSGGGGGGDSHLPYD